MPNGYDYPWDYVYKQPYVVMERDREAPHLGHSQHLCDMAKQGVALQVVKDLVKKNVPSVLTFVVILAS